MITRKEYLDRTVLHATHDAYYGEIAAALDISFRPSILEKIRESLANDDPHLNRISLGYWDSHAISLDQAAVRKLLEERGDSYSLSSGVCILKAAAKAAVEVHS